MISCNVKIIMQLFDPVAQFVFDHEDNFLRTFTVMSLGEYLVDLEIAEKGISFVYINHEGAHLRENIEEMDKFYSWTSKIEQMGRPGVDCTLLSRQVSNSAGTRCV